MMSIAAAAARLERSVDWRIDPGDVSYRARVTATPASQTLEELARRDAVHLAPTPERS